MATPTATKLARKAFTDMVTTAIEERIGKGALQCVACGSDTWDAQNLQGAIPSHEPGGRPPFGQIEASFPVVFVLCRNCGYTMMFNLISLGLQEELGITQITSESDG